MTCKRCGKEIGEGQRFCSYCGADQRENPNPQQNSSGPESNGQPPAGGGVPPTAGLNPSTGAMILKIFAVVCAVVYAVRALARLFRTFSSLGGALSVMQYRFFSGFVSLLTGPVCYFVLAVAYAWMCAVMLAFFLRKNRNGSDALFLGLCGGGALAVLVLVLRLIWLVLSALFDGFYTLKYYDWSSLFVLPVIGNVVAVGGVFLLLYLIGEAPLLGKTSDEIKAESGEIINAMRAAFESVKKEPSVRPDQPGAQTQQNLGDSNGSGPACQPGPAGPVSAVPLKTNRSLLAYILLNIITCGIYGYYFLYAMARDVNIVCNGDGKKTGGLVAFILLSFITCGFYALYWDYSLSNRLAANAPRYGLNFQENGTTILLWYLVGLLLCGIGPYVAMHILIKNTNSLCAAYNQANGLYSR